MFGKEKEIKPVSNSFLNQMMEDEDFEADNTEEIDTEVTIQTLNKQLQTVIIIEKISSVFAPYFLIIVGLDIYDRTWFLSMIFLSIGTISLLKITKEKVDNFLTWLKQALGYEQNQEN